MSDPLLRDALRLIQDIVAEAKGAPLEREAMRRVEEVLKRLAGADGAPDEGGGHSQREVTILFADLRGFSTIAASYPPQVVLSVLSRCFGMMTDMVVEHYGTVDKFMGDAIMAVFYGDPAMPHDHARRALLCAVEMQIGMNELRQRHREEGMPEVYLGIGISTGSVMAGLVGSKSYRAYTVIGEQVNLAARIEAFSLRGQVLMSEATCAHVRDFVQVGDPLEVHVKGGSRSLRIFEAVGIPELGKIVPRQDLRKSPRVDVKLAMEYRRLAGKLVAAQIRQGLVRDLSYYGALVEVGEVLPRFAEIKLAFVLPDTGYRVEDVYARVVSVREADGRHLAGLEFTSVGAEANGKIALYVQLRIQEEFGKQKRPL